MRHSSRPTYQCKGRSEPITENSSDTPPRCGPLAPDDRARRLAELRTALADAAPKFQARLRAGERGECAPRGTQYRTGVPFAALPHDIAADRRLTPTDLRVLAALLFYACSKPT